MNGKLFKVCILLFFLVILFGFVSCVSTSIEETISHDDIKVDRNFTVSYNYLGQSPDDVLKKLKENALYFVSSQTFLLDKDIDLNGDVIYEGSSIKEFYNGFSIRLIRKSDPVKINRGLYIKDYGPLRVESSGSKKEYGYLVKITDVRITVSNQKINITAVDNSYESVRNDPSFHVTIGMNKYLSMREYVRNYAYVPGDTTGNQKNDFTKEFIQKTVQGAIPPVLVKIGNGNLSTITISVPKKDHLHKFDYYDENLSLIKGMSLNGYYLHLDEPKEITIKFQNLGSSIMMNAGWTIELYKGWDKKPFRSGTLSLFVDSQVSLGELSAGDYYFLLYPWERDKNDVAALIGIDYTISLE